MISKHCCDRAEAPSDGIRLTPDARAALRAMADGDGRFLLNLVEEICALFPADVVLDPADLPGLCSSARRSTTNRRKGTTTDQRIAQISAGFGCRCRSLLARAHAGGRGGPITSCGG